MDDAPWRTPATGECRDVEDLQRLVHSSIYRLGGYWHPLSGLARLTEELGEFAELLDRNNSEDILLEEAADLIVISTCLANQYCANLTHAYESRGLPTTLDSIDLVEKPNERLFRFPKLVSAAGTVARIVNAYDGEKPPKADEPLPTMQSAVAEVHDHIFEFAASRGQRISHTLVRRLSRQVQRDKNRFARAYDPSMSPALRAFYHIVSHRRNNLPEVVKAWGAPPWDNAKSVEENARQARPVWDRFVRISVRERLDAFVISAPAALFGETTSALSDWAKTILEIVRLGDRPFGARTFGPSHGESSPGCTFGRQEVVLAFVAERA